jgi:hypothetical protein
MLGGESGAAIDEPPAGGLPTKYEPPAGGLPTKYAFPAASVLPGVPLIPRELSLDDAFVLVEQGEA